jgi:hypothetical protein
MPGSEDFLLKKFGGENGQGKENIDVKGGKKN